MKLGKEVLEQWSLGATCHTGRHVLQVPAYRRELQPGVVHLGLGAFHRAHQALVFDALLSGGDLRWGVLGVAMRNTALADSLRSQAGLYSVRIADGEGLRWRIGGAMLATAVAAREPARVTQAIAAPTTRWLTLTVTEKGYGPDLAALIVAGLAARRAAALPGLTIASCDNLSHNGGRLRELCLSEARATDPALAGWIAASCRFPDSMVDRIVPAATDETLRNAEAALGCSDGAALATEAFWEWVIERQFVDSADEQVLQGAGVKVVGDVRPYEDAKLRLLNGSHTALACIGAVAGFETVSACLGRPALRRFAHQLMTMDVAPYVSRPDVADYRDALLARFANGELRHRVHQIANDTSQKIPQRWLPTLLDNLRAGRMPQRLAFAAAAWIRFLRGVDDHGRTYVHNDPLAPQLQALALRHAVDAHSSARALLSVEPVWGTAAGNLLWQDAVAHWLGLINSKGMLAALEEFNEPGESQ